ATRTATVTPVRTATPVPTATPAAGTLNPELVGFVPGVGSAMDVTLDNGLAFVASDVFGVSVIDSSVPTVVGSSRTAFLGEHSAVRGQRGVATGHAEDGTPHLWVLDLTDATQPVVVGELAGVASDAFSGVAL